MQRRKRYFGILLLSFFIFIFLLRLALPSIGNVLVENSPEQPYNTAVILAGSYYERFLELYDRQQSGEITKFFITWTNKPESRLKFEEIAGKMPLPSEITKRVLMEKGVPKENIVILPKPVHSTRDEAIQLGQYMREHEIKGMAIITSKYHSHRACWVFRKINPDLKFSCIASRYDNFNPNDWWKSRRSIMKVVSEYVKWVGYQMEFIANRKLAS